MKKIFVLLLVLVACYSFANNMPTIRISTISYSGNPECIEIKNYGSSIINLLGWKITDEGAKHEYIFRSAELRPDCVIRIYSGNKATENIWTKVYIWNNDGDTGYLYNPKGELVNSFSYLKN